MNSTAATEDVPVRIQMTEVGVLPSDWTVVPLISLADKIMVGIASAATHAYRNVGVVMFRNQNIRPGQLDTEDVLYIAPSYEQSYKNKRLRAGDLLTARTGYPGTTSLVPEGYEGAQSFTTLITRPRLNAADPQYLCLYINGRAGQRYFEQAQIGGGQKNVNAASLKQLPVALPSSEREQRAIATALTDTDALIGSLEQLLTKKRQIKQGAMQELLSGRRRLSGFTGAWISCLWGDVIDECSSGATPLRSHPEYYRGSIRWISSGELNYNVIEETLEHISAEALEKTNLKIHPAGTFLMAITGLEAAGTRGACGIVGMPAATNQSCMAVYPTSKLLTAYLFHYYVYKGDELALRYCQGTKQQSYTAALIRVLPIEYPESTDEQLAITQVVSDMDAEITALEHRLTKARDLKQAMAQALLTGRIRFVEPQAA